MTELSIKRKREHLRDRVMAMFLLSAIGDALGMPVETLKKGEIQERFDFIREYMPARSDHKWCKDFVAGQWTDDTQLTLAIARSYIRVKDIDVADIYFEHLAEMQRITAGWGGSTLRSLERIRKAFPNGIELVNAGNPQGAGNGVAMKVSPIGAILAANFINADNLFSSNDFWKYWSSREKFVYNQIEALAQMTHRTRMGVASGFAQVRAIVLCLEYGSKNFVNDFKTVTLRAAGIGERRPLDDGMTDKLTDRFKVLWKNDAYMEMSVDELLVATSGATCYAFNSLPFTYSMFLKDPTSIETLYQIINAGGDTDTNGAIVGALLGAYNGTKIIPPELLSGLWNRKEVEDTAIAFCDSLNL